MLRKLFLADDNHTKKSPTLVGDFSYFCDARFQHLWHMAT